MIITDTARLVAGKRNRGASYAAGPYDAVVSNERWTDEAAIEQWEMIPRESLDAMAYDGDFAKRHLINPVLFRMLGDLDGRRVLDAGCGNGYLSRLLATAGAEVVGVEPTDTMIGYARQQESEQPQGIDYVQASLTRLPGPPASGESNGSAALSAPFDAVVCSMVLQAIPSWRAALAACVERVRPGGMFVFSVNHPAFEDLATVWRQHGEYRMSRYLREYEMPQTFAVDWHRPLSAYLNELAGLGCRILEVAEPGLDPDLAGAEEARWPGVLAYAELPNFLIVAAEKPAAPR